MFIAIYLLSFFISCALIKYANHTGKMMDLDSAKKPQKMHFGDVPRAGGVGVFVAFCAGIVALVAFDKIEAKFLALLIPAILIFTSGILEDFNRPLSPKTRLFLQTLGAISAIVAFPNCVITDIGVELYYDFAVFFTIFCIVGVINAINIIDGFNALAGGYALFVLISIAVVSAFAGNVVVCYIALVLLSAIFGFLVLNFPNAKIFLGDGGAYLVGFLLAFLLVILTQDSAKLPSDSANIVQSVETLNAPSSKSTFVSAYFGLCVMIYPVFEVLFSIWRRKKRKLGALTADNLHLHTLIFKRITHSNPKTTIFLLIFNAPFIIVPIFFYDNTPILIALCAVFIALYIVIYKRIIRFKRIFIKNSVESQI